MEILPSRSQSHERDADLVQIKGVADNSTPKALSPSRYDLQRFLRKVSKSERIRCCGLRRVKPLISFRSNGVRMAIDGLGTCGSPWACPVCSDRSRQAKSDEVSSAVETSSDRGGSTIMLTLTVGHRPSDALKRLLDVVVKSWSCLTQSGTWASKCVASGVADWVRVLEIKHGPNGWHPHLHVLLFIQPGTAQGQAMFFARWVTSRWVDVVEKQGLARPSRRRQSISLRPAPSTSIASDRTRSSLPTSESSHWDRAQSAGTYLAKGAGIPAEWTNSNTFPTPTTLESTPALAPRVSTQTCWHLLERALNGDKGSLRLWHEYVDATHGKRTQQWSQSGRARVRAPGESAVTAASPSVNVDAVQNRGGESVDVWCIVHPDVDVVIRPQMWDLLCRTRPAVADQVKAATRMPAAHFIQELNRLDVVHETRPNPLAAHTKAS
jgi:hypothetical protein